MKAIRLSFFQMAAAMRRDMMLFVSCFAPILAGFFFRFAIPLIEAALTDNFHIAAIISPYYKLVDILFAMLSSTMFCFVSAMISLEERDEKTAVYLFITPLRKTGYIVARFGVPSAIAFLATIILLPVFKLTPLSPLTILLLATGGTLQGMIVALLVLTVSSNKLEGMAEVIYADYFWRCYPVFHYIRYTVCNISATLFLDWKSDFRKYAVLYAARICFICYVDLLFV